MPKWDLPAKLYARVACWLPRWRGGGRWTWGLYRAWIRCFGRTTRCCLRCRCRRRLEQCERGPCPRRRRWGGTSGRRHGRSQGENWSGRFVGGRSGWRTEVGRRMTCACGLAIARLHLGGRRRFLRRQWRGGAKEGGGKKPTPWQHWSSYSLASCPFEGLLARMYLST